MIVSSQSYSPEHTEQAPQIDEIRNLSGYALLEFGTPWCGHCDVAMPAVKEVMSKIDLLHIKVLDGKGKVLGRSFKIKLWPTLILLNSGQEIARIIRPTQVIEVKEFLKKNNVI